MARIMVADDSWLQRQMLGKMLKEQGYGGS